MVVGLAERGNDLAASGLIDGLDDEDDSSREATMEALVRIVTGNAAVLKCAIQCGQTGNPLCM